MWPEEDVGEAHAALSTAGLEPRGYMFWNLEDEGRQVEGTGRALFLAKELAEQVLR